jgi:hypothetical protein
VNNELKTMGMEAVGAYLNLLGGFEEIHDKFQIG